MSLLVTHFYEQADEQRIYTFVYKIRKIEDLVLGEIFYEIITKMDEAYTPVPKTIVFIDLTHSFESLNSIYKHIRTKTFMYIYHRLDISHQGGLPPIMATQIQTRHLTQCDDQESIGVSLQAM